MAAQIASTGAPRSAAVLQARVALQMPGREALRRILGAAEGVDVERVGHRIVQGDLDDLGVVAAHPQALAQDQRVAAVAVGAHDIGQHQSDPDGRLRHAAPFAMRVFRSRNAV